MLKVGVLPKGVDMDLADVEVKFGELEAELSETNAVNDKLQRFYYEIVEYKLLLDKPIDPTKQVKLGFLNGVEPCEKSMVFERILF